MAKRNTSGGPRQRIRSSSDLAGRELSRSEKNRRNQEIAVRAAAVVGVIIAIIFVGALAYDQFILPNEALVTVNDQEYDVGLFRDRVQYARFQLSQQIRSYYDFLVANGTDEADAQQQAIAVYSGQQQGGSGPVDFLINTELQAQNVLQQIEREIIIEQAAEQYGITAEVDEEAVQEVINDLTENFTARTLDPTNTPTPTDVPTETPTPLVSSTPTEEPSETPLPTETTQPTAEGCAEGDEECPTVTPLPTNTPTETPTETPEFTDTPEPTNTPVTASEARSTAVAFQNSLVEDGGDFSGLDEDAIREVFYYEALRIALRDYLSSDEEAFPEYYVSDTEIWVDARHILIGFPEGEIVAEGDENEYFTQAMAVYDALLAGEPFAALAAANSTDTSNAEDGGYLGFNPSNNYVDAFKTATETLPIGEISMPIRTEFGYHIIQVMDRDSRVVSESLIEQRQEENFATWLSEQQVLANIVRMENWRDLVPDGPDWNDLLGDIVEFNFDDGFQFDEVEEDDEEDAS